MTPAELGAGREPAPERPGATVVAPRDRGARCLPRGASHRPAAGLRGGSASRAAVSVAVGPAPRCPGGHDRLYPAVLLFSLSASPLSPPAPPGPRGSGALRSRSAFATKQQQKTSGLFGAPWSGARLTGPLPAELALRDLAASVVGAPRALVPPLPHALRARWLDSLKAPMGHFHSASKGQKNNPGAGSQPQGSFRCPSWATCWAVLREPRSQQNSLSLSS